MKQNSGLNTFQRKFTTLMQNQLAIMRDPKRNRIGYRKWAKLRDADGMRALVKFALG